MKRYLLTSIALTALYLLVYSSEAFTIGNLHYTVLKNHTVEVSSQGYGIIEGNLEIPDRVVHGSITYRVTTIGSSAFTSSKRLTSVTIPNSVTTIKYGAFSGCTGLSYVNIPNSVTFIGGYAFCGCTGLTSITIPSSVTSFGGNAFENCTGLTSVTLTNGLTNIGDEAFKGCTGLTSVTFPNSMTYIAGVFVGCTGLTSVTIPNSVTIIGAKTFEGCTGLTSITIPNSVTNIKYRAFKDCTGLTSITIPNNVTSIENTAFEGCTGLTSVTIYTTPPLDVNYIPSFSKDVKIYVPCEIINKYINHKYWSYIWSQIYCIEAEEVQTNTNSKITPNVTSATITWSIESEADSFKIVLTNNGKAVITININSEGQITSIDFAKGQTKGAELQTATASLKGFSYEIPGLDPDTEYEYTVTTYDANSAILRTDTGSFKTLKGTVGVEESTYGKETLKDKLYVSGRKLSVGGTDISDVKIYNTSGQQVSNPVPAAGVYLITVGNETAKILVK